MEILTPVAPSPPWAGMESEVKWYLAYVCPRLKPADVGIEAFTNGALKRAKDQYERHLKEVILAGDTDRPITVSLWYLSVRAALDERRWLVGRGEYATAELKSYTSAHLMQAWNFKSDIEKALERHATKSDVGLKSAKSIKLLFANRYSEEELCRFWYDDYTPTHRNELKELVRHDTDELHATLRELRLSPIKGEKGDRSATAEARAVLEDIGGQQTDR